MTQQALDVIETLQPYHSGDAFREHPLWQLHKLDIVDKHRRIAISHSEWNVGSREFSRRKGHGVNKGDGYVEFTFPIYSPSIDILLSKPTIEFGAEDEGLSLKPERLEEIYKFVTADVLPRFKPFFD